MLVRGPPLSPGVVRGVGTTSRDPLPRAPLSVGASAAEWEILDGKRVDLQSGAPGPAGPGSGPFFCTDNLPVNLSALKAKMPTTCPTLDYRHRKGVVRILRGALRILTRTMVRSRSHRLTGGRWGSCASAGGAADRGRSGAAR